jgi:hypothetical protein
VLLAGYLQVVVAPSTQVANSRSVEVARTVDLSASLFVLSCILSSATPLRALCPWSI